MLLVSLQGPSSPARCSPLACPVVQHNHSVLHALLIPHIGFKQFSNKLSALNSTRFSNNWSASNSNLSYLTLLLPAAGPQGLWQHACSPSWTLDAALLRAAADPRPTAGLQASLAV